MNSFDDNCWMILFFMSASMLLCRAFFALRFCCCLTFMLSQELELVYVFLQASVLNTEELVDFYVV
jgi:hypothetical protein